MGGDLLHNLATSALVIVLWMLVWYVVALIRHDYRIVHLIWGPGAVLAVLAPLWWYSRIDLRQMVAVTLIGIWGLRSGLHALFERWDHPREPRHFFHGFWSVFVVRALLMLFAILPAVVVLSLDIRPPVRWLAWIGIGLWLVGFMWELIADHRDVPHRVRLGQWAMWFGIWLLI